MAGWIDVVWCPNPLMPASDRRVRRLMLNDSETVDAVIKRLALNGTSLTATLNGIEVPKKRRHKKPVKHGDHLVLMQVAHGIESWFTAEAIMVGEKSIATAELIGTVAGLAANAAAVFLLSSAANALLGSPHNAPNMRKDPDGYSIEGGTNQPRPYGPLTLVLGEHRVFADYGSRPFTEFINDPTATIEVINSSPHTEDMTPPDFYFLESPPAEPYTPVEPWVQIGGSLPENYGYFGDGATRTYTDPSETEVTMPHTFVVRANSSGNAEVTTWEDYIAPPPPDDGGGA